LRHRYAYYLVLMLHSKPDNEFEGGCVPIHAASSRRADPTEATYDTQVRVIAREYDERPVAIQQSYPPRILKQGDLKAKADA